MEKVFLFAFTLLVSWSLTRCKTIDTLYTYKNPEPHAVDMNKVLVVGLTTNANSRSLVEDRLVHKFNEKGIDAIKSINYFSNHGTNFISKQDLENEEENLIKKGFTNILISKLVSTDERRTILQTILKLMKSYNSFDNDNDYSDFSLDETKIAKYITYNTQTAIYCICPGKDKSLIWNTTIELKKHKSIKYDIKRYANYLFKEINSELLFLD